MRKDQCKEDGRIWNAETLQCAEEELLPCPFRCDSDEAAAACQTNYRCCCEDGEVVAPPCESRCASDQIQNHNPRDPCYCEYRPTCDDILCPYGFELPELNENCECVPKTCAYASCTEYEFFDWETCECQPKGYCKMLCPRSEKLHPDFKC